MSSMKIGDEIFAKEKGYLSSVVGDNVITINPGDKAVVTKTGVKYLTGDARGKYVYKDMRKENLLYNTDNIARRVADNIINSFGYDFKESLEELGISKEDLIDVILEELDEFI